MSITLDAESLPLIEEHVRRLVGLMGFSSIRVHCHATLPAAKAIDASDDWLHTATLEPTVTTAPSEPTLTISIEAGREGKLLIGSRGAHLDALQHVLRMCLRRQVGEEIRIVVDVNQYRHEREQALQHQATAAAQQAIHTRRPIQLEAMTPADRRIIHATLSARADIQTESRGKEPKRFVVVRPA